MRMDKKKLVAVPFVIAVLLSSLAFGYAAWMDAVTIDVTAKMGTLNVAFSTTEEPSSVEYYFNPDPPPDRLLGEFEDKDVGWCDSHYEDLVQDPHTLKEGYEKLVIEIKNAYPQYIVHTTFIVSNLGTIPVIIYGFELDGVKTDKAGVVECTLLWYDPDGDLVGEIWEDTDGSGTVNAGDVLVMNAKVQNQEFPIQIDKCNEEKMEFDLDFKQEAAECHTYILKLKLLAIQWNKIYEVYTPPPPPPP
jgi:hypothetical protein